MSDITYQHLYKIREPQCKTVHRGAFIVHFFSTKQKADAFAKSKGFNGKDAEVLGPNTYPVFNGYIISGIIDKEN